MSFVPASLCRRVPPLGPMPNEQLDGSNLESLEKYRSYNRYFRQAQEVNNKPVWWHTYRKYVEKEDPQHGEMDIFFTSGVEDTYLFSKRSIFLLLHYCILC